MAVPERLLHGTALRIYVVQHIGALCRDKFHTGILACSKIDVDTTEATCVGRKPKAVYLILPAGAIGCKNKLDGLELAAPLGISVQGADEACSKVGHEVDMAGVGVEEPNGIGEWELGCGCIQDGLGNRLFGARMGLGE